MTSLHGAIPFTQINRILVLVSNDLDFNVPWVLEEFLHIHSRIVEGRAGLCLGHGNRVDQSSFGVHHTHATTTAAASGLDDHRVTDGLGNPSYENRIVWQLALRAGYARYTCANHGLLGRNLVAHDPDGLRRGSNELESAFLHPLREIGVFT